MLPVVLCAFSLAVEEQQKAEIGPSCGAAQKVKQIAMINPVFVRAEPAGSSSVDEPKTNSRGVETMRKKAVNQVYGVIQAVYELERELKSGPAFDDIDRADCSEHLKQAREQLREVLDQVYASDFRNPRAA
jgi:hypothetical protein